MGATKALNFIAMLFVGFLLAHPHVAFAQGLDEATTLNQQVIQLYRQGRYSEAIALEQRVVAIQQKALGPEHPDVATSLNNLALLYRVQGRYTEAEVLYKRSLAITEKARGPDHPDVAASLNNLAVLYKNQGRYADAELLYNRSLVIREKALGPDHPDVATSLNNLAVLYSNQGRHSDAELLYKRSLAIKEKAFGPDHPNVATLLNNLAGLYHDQGRYADAELLYKRSLAIKEKALGPDHPDVATSLNNLAGLYQLQARYADAEPLYKRSLTISETTFGPDHPDVAIALNNLAGLYNDQGRYTELELLYKRSLAINEKAFGPYHPDVATLLNNLARLYSHQGRYAEAELLYKRSLAINEKAFGPYHPDVATLLNNLAEFYQVQGRYADAEPLYNRSLVIREKVLGPDHPDVATSLSNLARLYYTQGRNIEAEPLLKRSLAIREKALGPDHPDVSQSLNSLAVLYSTQGLYAEAEPLYKRSLAIKEKAFSPDHPDIAQALNNLAMLYSAQGRYTEVEQFYKRSLLIREKALGLDHLDVAESLNNLASFYQIQGRYAEAEPLYRRSLAIREKALGPDHPAVALPLNDLAVLYSAQGRYTEAEVLFKRSLAINEKAFGPDHREVATLQNNLALLYDVQARYADALPIVKKTMSQKSAKKSVAFAVMYHSQSQKLISPPEALQASYNVLQRSSSSAAGKAVSMLAARFAAGSNELAQLVRKDQDLTAEAERLDKNLIASVSNPPTERNKAAEDQIRRRIDEINSEHDALQDAFSQRFPDYVALSKPQPLSLQETQALLDNDEALVAVDLDKPSYVWVITRNRAEWEQLSVSAEDVSKSVATLRSALDPESSKPFERSVAYQLYHQILGPIAEVISQKKRLSFVLSGELTSLPPQVLITSDPEGKDFASVDWLVRKYAITVLPSVASLKILRGGKSVVAAAKPMIGFGDAIFDRTARIGTTQKVASRDRSLTVFYRGITADTVALAQALPPLPETADELRAVAKELGATPEDIKLGAAASVLNVKHAQLDNYRVIYFATHALVAGEVEKFAKVKAEPALVLSIPEKPTEEDDGLLRASDVAMLRMNADFVVLSACNTAAGEIPGAEALSGLARAFLYAGARSLLVSNWEVDSESTVALMIGLFEHLKANPHLSHAEALRLSMLKMIDNRTKQEWAQPKFWAPFVVIGEPQKN